MSLHTPDFMQGSRILVVEDDFLIALDLEERLHKLGCDVVGPFERLDKALAAVDNELHGAIVDINLRGQYSFELIDRLREEGVPTIVCSGYASISDVQDKLRDIPLLPKPCNPDELLKLMEKNFVRSSQFRGSTTN